MANFVNVTGGIYRTNGHLAMKPFFLNPFFGETADAFTSDPRVFFDPDSQRWMATILEADFDSNGDISASRVDLAVSQTPNPTGKWNVYRIDTTNNSHFHCPCLPDYPILGVDHENVYISTNEFTTDLQSFNGAQLYALSKSQLAAGDASVNMVFFQNLSMAGAPAFHVQPANEYGSPSAEWLMSSLDPNGTSDDRLGVWAVTHEARVTAGHGMPLLSSKVVDSEMYAFPPNAQTPPGFCGNCESGAGAPTTGVVQTDWDAMQETQYINDERGVPRHRDDHPWRVRCAHRRGLVRRPPCAEQERGERGHDGRAPGYVGIRGEYLLYPHINLLDNGMMALTFGMGGMDTYLSAAYAVAEPGRGFPNVAIAGAGAFPDNGFTGSQQYGGEGRWGDYSNGEISRERTGSGSPPSTSRTLVTAGRTGETASSS